jgi:TPP-dependent pyruvate/acetoin dehydrogenase alpha subunit
MNRCPIKALEGFLLDHSVMSESEKSQIFQAIDKEIEEALAFAKESPYPEESELTDNVFKLWQIKKAGGVSNGNSCRQKGS